MYTAKTVPPEATPREQRPPEWIPLYSLDQSYIVIPELAAGIVFHRKKLHLL